MTQNEYYEVFDAVAMWIWFTLWGTAILCSVSYIVVTVMKWSQRKGIAPPKRSDMSDDFALESRRVLDVIRERDEFGTAGNLLSDKNRAELDSLYDSSEFASLVRFAHYAGYNLSFEEWGCEWEDDPEYLDPGVFKTDMKDAASKREAEKLNRYKRYFDPPKSKREQALSNIS